MRRYRRCARFCRGNESISLMTILSMLRERDDSVCSSSVLLTKSESCHRGNHVTPQVCLTFFKQRECLSARNYTKFPCASCNSPSCKDIQYIQHQYITRHIPCLYKIRYFTVLNKLLIKKVNYLLVIVNQI